MWVSSFEFRVSGCRLPVAGCRMRSLVSSFRFQVSGLGLPVSDFGLQPGTATSRKCKSMSKNSVQSSLRRKPGSRQTVEILDSGFRRNDVTGGAVLFLTRPKHHRPPGHHREPMSLVYCRPRARVPRRGAKPGAEVLGHGTSNLKSETCNMWAIHSLTC
jgi:hypothetical protein